MRQVFLTPDRTIHTEKEKLFLASAREVQQVGGSPVWRWGSGPKVLLIHGWSGRGAQMSEFVAPLVGLGYEVLMVDAPGHGLAADRKTNLRVFTELVEALSHREGEFSAAVGHSLGAAALVAAASRGVHFRRLVLIGMPADLSKIFSSFCQRVGLKGRALKFFEAAVQEEVGLRSDELSAVKVAPQLPIQTLLIHDPQDPQVAVDSVRSLALLWPESRLELIEKVGHFRILRSKICVDIVSQFLQDPD